MTTKLGLHGGDQPLLLLPHSLKPPFLLFLSFGRWPMVAQANFSRFPLVFHVLWALDSTWMLY